MSGEILFLAHRLPFPPDRGDKIRSHHIVKALAKIAPVHIGCLAEELSDFAHEHFLEELAASYCMAPRPPFLPIAGLKALIRREPVSLAAFHSKQLRQWVKNTLATRKITAIYVFSGQMGQYVPQSWIGRLIVDLVDVDSAKFEAFAKDGSGPRAWIDARESKLLRDVEARLVERASSTLLVSHAEAQLLRSRISGQHDIRALSNGIDCSFFDPALIKPHPALGEGGPHLVFTGQMDYAPNIAAVSRMANDIMPRLIKALPQASFHIVGRAPSRDVIALKGVNGVSVVGEVPDTRPWLAGADMVVAPLTIARGVQNKVLEAMAMARPVVVTPDAATGIDAEHGRHFIIAENDGAFIHHITQLHSAGQQAAAMGLEARKLVRDQMSWRAMLADLPVLTGFAGGAVRDAA